MKFSLNVTFSTLNELEFFLYILYLGGISSLIENKENLDKIEYELFRPAIVKELKKNILDKISYHLRKSAWNLETYIVFLLTN